MIICHWAIYYFLGFNLGGQLYSQPDPPLRAIAISAGERLEADMRAPSNNPFIKSNRLLLDI